ncbi:hypothetical protein [Pedobacter borealis]|uniref:hypothetical protein n=1 Tax=Pedobacter borealis TaxID=475254 RepID=UPI0004935090|nr:hypothetical protein [Pedobacter borealis]
MLKAFSWPDFLLASIILSLFWWAVIWLIYFRRKGLASAEPLDHNWDHLEEEFESELMGKPVLDTGVKVVEADDFSFGVDVGADRDSADQVERLGDLADVQAEIREVCKVLAAEDGTKDDFFVLFEMVRNKYPKLGLSASLPALNGFIREHVPFALSEEELEGIWA